MHFKPLAGYLQNNNASYGIQSTVNKEMLEKTKEAIMKGQFRDR